MPVPTGCSIFPKEIFRPSRRWAEKRFTTSLLERARPKGGHFAAFEQPELFVGALCLATDLGMGFPLEHGLQSTQVAMRLADRLGVDSATASQTYYGCLLFYVGCTVDAEIAPGCSTRGHLLGTSPR